MNNFEGSKAIVYYCGHGIPDEKTGDAYIVPVDGKGTNTATCYSLNKLYTTLAATKAANITYFMDVCETSGDVSYEELAGYINKNVKKEAFLINEKPQPPVVATSPKVATSWKTMKLK